MGRVVRILNLSSRYALGLMAQESVSASLLYCEAGLSSCHQATSSRLEKY